MKNRKSKYGLLFSMLLILGIGFNACQEDEDDTNNVTQQDQAFVKDISALNIAEIELGRLALQRTTHDSLTLYAGEMIGAHTEAQSQLQSIAGNLNIAISDSMPVGHYAFRGSLMVKTGFLFDTTYISKQVRDHINARTLLQRQIRIGQNGSLIEYANRYLPLQTVHLKRALGIRDSLIAHPPLPVSGMFKQIN